MLTTFSKKPVQSAKPAEDGLYIGKKLLIPQIEKLAQLLGMDLQDYKKQSTSSGLHGTAIFLDILGNCLLANGVQEQAVREFINSLQ
jgi:hypothetical protein